MFLECEFIRKEEKMSSKIKAGIIGAAGFTGRELLRIFAHHTGISIEYITAGQNEGVPVGRVFSELDFAAYENLCFTPHPQSKDDLPALDVVFLAATDEVSLHWTPILLDLGIKVIDISGAFRLKDVAEFGRYYKMEHSAAELLPRAQYGMPELYREKIKQADLIANPGCYATSAVLPVHFLGKHKALFRPLLILDSKSGTSGAGGRKEKDSMPYSSVQENFRAYRMADHQHIPEILQEVAPGFATPPKMKMTPHLLPLFRGILSVTYLEAKEPLSPETLEEIRQGFIGAAAQEPFVRYYETPEEVELKKVQLTNYLDFSMQYDPEIQILVLVSAIDNLVKGAAGQAVVNFNLVFGFDETTALR